MESRCYRITKHIFEHAGIKRCISHGNQTSTLLRLFIYLIVSHACFQIHLNIVQMTNSTSKIIFGRKGLRNFLQKWGTIALFLLQYLAYKKTRLLGAFNIPLTPYRINCLKTGASSCHTRCKCSIFIIENIITIAHNSCPNMRSRNNHFLIFGCFMLDELIHKQRIVLFY